MKGIRFYLEHKTPQDKRKDIHAGNVFARYLDISGFGRNVEGAGAVYNWPNSDCCHSQASIDYLWENCRRISEDKAREIHPALFEYLEQ